MNKKKIRFNFFYIQIPDTLLKSAKEPESKFFRESESAMYILIQIQIVIAITTQGNCN